MLRIYSIMQLGHLWTNPPRTTPGSYTTDDDAIDEDDDDDDDDDSIIDVHPVAVETTDIQEQQEESMTTGYQARNEADHQLCQHTKDTMVTEENESTSSTPTITAFSSSMSLSASSDPGLPTVLKNQPMVATFVHKENQEENDDDDDEEEEEDSIKKNDYYYYQPPPHHQQVHFHRPLLHHLQIHPPYQYDLPSLTYDLTSITEEDPTEINDSSMISSTGSLPRTPTSTASTPLRRKRPGIKFNERRKNMANKLKRVFSSKTNSKRSNST